MTDKQHQYLTIQYDKIVADTTMLAVTRMLALNVSKNPYMSVKDFLETLSDGDLDLLLLVSEEEDNKHFGELIIISEILAQTEGIISEHKSTDEMLDHTILRVQTLASFLAIEGLGRKGLVKVYRENMSFGEDQGHKLIVERLDVDK